MGGKWLALLKEIAPAMTRVAWKQEGAKSQVDQRFGA
jgi:hypothetical protein